METTRGTAPAAGHRLRRFLYGLALFLASAGALVIEIVAGRILAPYVGMSLYTWTAIIAVVLAGLSIGHWIGGRLAGADQRSCYTRLAATLALAALFTALSLVLLRVLSPLVLGSGLDPVLGIVLLTGALFLFPSLFVGVVSPILTKMAVDSASSAPGQAIGQMFAAGAAGSIAGTLVAGYLFISWIGSTGTVLSIAVLYAVLAGVFAVCARPGRAALAATFAALAVFAVAVALWGRTVRAWTSPCTEESDYYCIRVIDYSGETGRPSRLMVLDHLGHGINVADDPTLIVTPYLDLVDHLLRLRLAPREDTAFTAFFIGGGAYTLPRAWASAYPAARLMVAEIDPAVTRTAREEMWFEGSPRLAILHEDARVALRRLPRERRFDVVLGDAFKDIAIPTHLVSREFAHEIAKRLTPRGFYAVNVVDSGTAPRLLLSMARTLAAVFPVVEVWADRDALLGAARATYLLVAGRRATPTNRILARRVPGRMWLRWPAAELAERLRLADPPVLSDDYAPVDRLVLPVLRAGP